MLGLGNIGSIVTLAEGTPRKNRIKRQPPKAFKQSVPQNEECLLVL